MPPTALQLTWVTWECGLTLLLLAIQPVLTSATTCHKRCEHRSSCGSPAAAACCGSSSSCVARCARPLRIGSPVAAACCPCHPELKTPMAFCFCRTPCGLTVCFLHDTNTRSCECAVLRDPSVCGTHENAWVDREQHASPWTARLAPCVRTTRQCVTHGYTRLVSSLAMGACATTSSFDA